VGALSETRLKGHGQLTEQHYTFFWTGGDLHQAGVAFAIRKDMLTRLAAVPSTLSDRLSSIGITLFEKRFLTLVAVYAPTTTYDEATRANFHADLGRVLSNVPKADKHFVLGDFNARVGNDRPGWSHVLGTQARGRTNTNGSLLLELCIGTGTLTWRSPTPLPCLTSGTIPGCIHTHAPGTCWTTSLCIDMTLGI